MKTKPTFLALWLLLLIATTAYAETRPSLLPTGSPPPSHVAEAYPVFSTTLEVIPASTILVVSDTLTVTVQIRDESVECTFYAMELTLSQQGPDAPIFEHVSPATVGPPITRPFSLTAVHTGTITFSAYAFGEYGCSGGWYWGAAWGDSEPVSVWVEKYQTYLPMILGIDETSRPGAIMK
ncbi:MAG: hypothetical protein JSV81_00030 [Anaerolineales bacterium]|nr:MAG: hypothetical protein JSV81_00030 [Anaerolineales bacterium]